MSTTQRHMVGLWVAVLIAAVGILTPQTAWAACDGAADGIADPTEDCDGADLDGGTCLTESYAGGTLSCSATCNYVRSACTNDLDGDGFDDEAFGGTDCDDTPVTGFDINPDADEVCDGIDNNCNDDIDEDDPNLVGAFIVYADLDGDNYGDPTAPIQSCDAAGAGESDNNQDCDDTPGTGFDINPDADEVCDEDNDIDENCNGEFDDGDDDIVYSAADVWYADTDGDGFGDPDVSTETCAPPTDYVQNPIDCDDTSTVAADVFPGADEICDGIDNDCDGDIDDDDSVVLDPDRSQYYPDADSDRFPNLDGAFVVACTAPIGYLASGSADADCDDTNSAINTAADEICDGIDNDCDEDIDDDDDDVTDASKTDFFPDGDADGYPDLTGTPVSQCQVPFGHLDPFGLSTDCDDSRSSINPGELEICDGLDNDCDAAIDDADDSITGANTWYSDLDGDSYGDPAAAILSCDTAPGPGEVINSDDCDDTTEDIAPGATELCDGRRNDCSTGTGIPTDEIDLDGDAYVECGFDGTLTWHGATTVNVGVDCGPRDPTTYPYASEVCDGIYNNCEASTYSATAAPANETDNDSDNHVECFDGSTTWQSAFTNPTVGQDCDDTDGTVYPSAPEICDGQYNDCDDPGYGSQDAPDDQLDDDGDFYVECRDGSVTWVGSASVLVGTDCDDDDADVHPGAIENGVCDGIDTDCDGTISWSQEQDADADGYVQCNFQTASWKGSTEVLGGLDCDDTEASVHPGAAEICDGRFNDCDDRLYTVQDAPDEELDDDLDGYVECRDGTVSWVGDSTVDVGEDCDDTDAFTFPGAAPLDVDPLACSTDADLDGWGDAAALDPVEPGTDCDDSAADTWPGAPELCEDGTARDNDCDGNPNTENGGPLSDSAGGSLEVYWDADGDGWGSTDVAATLVCDRENLEGIYAFTNSDCDDDNPTVYPGAPEICNGEDDNCNGQTDRLDELDPDLSGCVQMFRDLDVDGYGDSDVEACLCTDDSDALGAYDDDDRYVIFDQDCDDTDPDTHPLTCRDGIDNDGDGAADEDDLDCKAGLDETGSEVEKAYELIDGNDNDCDGRIAAVELDCDDDGSFALLPRQTSAILRAEEAGLLACGESGTVRNLSCWGEPELQLECDLESGLWMYRYADATDDLVGDRFDGGRRTWTGSRPCSSEGDCDDQCASRCPDLDEACDGIDNDCSASDLRDQRSSDIAGLPDSMFSSIPVAGSVPEAELDVDLDGYLACDDLTSSAPQIHMASGSCGDIVSDGNLLVDCERRCSLTFPGAEERCNGFLDDCSGEPEGGDGDFDGHRSCGAWSAGGQDEMPEDVVVVVWVAPESDATATLDTAESVATDDTASADSGTALDTGTRPDADLAYVPLILPRVYVLDTARARRRGDSGEVVFSCDTGADDDRPARVVYACDEPLWDALSALIGRATLEDAICESDGPALLDACERGGGSCGIVAVTLDPSVDTDLWTDDVPTADLSRTCEDRPEELISRGVWPAERIVSAREATVAAECLRLYGVQCDQVSPSTPLITDWDVMLDTSDALAKTTTWWKELDRFDLEPLTTGTVGWCWGDPTEGVNRVSERTGGDCADDASKAHRDAAEGPADLMGLLDPDGPADCDTCLDGIDNNCDGQVDCADPACAPCFVGQGVGCGGGDQAPCAGAGCWTGRGANTSEHRGLVLLCIAFFAAMVRRREAA